jgi:LmbE family N-acetylglucosaminyl deacetylase
MSERNPSLTNMNKPLPDKLKMMCILAHPDDETLGLGGVLAKYAAAGIETYLITATRGENGWTGAKEDFPGHSELGEIRTAELEKAAAVLGIKEVIFLDYADGELDQADPEEVISKIVSQIRRLRPQVVITFDSYGVYGHPDHIAISQFATASIVAASDSNFLPESETPHRVSKLYYMASTKDELVAYESLFGELVMNIDGSERRAAGWEEWSITTRIDTKDFWPQIWQAISCHQSQLPMYDDLLQLPEEQLSKLWQTQYFYRAFSFVNRGRNLETDLFDGL